MRAALMYIHVQRGIPNILFGRFEPTTSGRRRSGAGSRRPVCESYTSYLTLFQGLFPNFQSFYSYTSYTLTWNYTQFCTHYLRPSTKEHFDFLFYMFYRMYIIALIRSAILWGIVS